MAPKKKKIVYICTGCGNEFPKWQGKCSVCGEWNTLVETEVIGKTANKRTTSEAKEDSLIRLDSIQDQETPRLTSQISEFDLICGGGIIPGSVILIGGEPGIGKSTLALQLASKFKTLYFSGEESPVQIKNRANRLQIPMQTIYLSSSTSVENICNLVKTHPETEIIIIDSIQTLQAETATGSVGSVSQIKESTNQLIELAKTSNLPVVIIGHITKEGNIAGPKTLEHMVDTVLYFEGDFTHEYRLLRSFKNRFGSVNEIGLFKMTNKGLSEVADKNAIFLNPFDSTAPGNAVSAACEGSRTIIFEVQALVAYSSFSFPRRMGDGLDFNRLIILVAVLEKHAGLKLGQFDVFINLAGGFKITETSADLAIALAIASSLTNKKIPEKIGFLGEISLSGEIRPVSQLENRLQEFERSNFEQIYLSPADAQRAKELNLKCQIRSVQNISQAVSLVLQ